MENAPQYDKKSLRFEDEWKKFEQEFKEYWAEDPAMHLKGSDRIIIPPDAAVPAQATSATPGARLKPRWWDTFEELRLNKSDIHAKCSQCTSPSEQKRGAA